MAVSQLFRFFNKGWEGLIREWSAWKVAASTYGARRVSFLAFPSRPISIFFTSPVYYHTPTPLPILLVLLGFC